MAGSECRVLVAGVGNLLRGDDGFGIEALRRLRAELGEVPDVHYFESGIAGISLVQELLDGYDALILLDAVERGAAPGEVFVLAPDLAALASPNAPREPVDLHQADPEGVLRMAGALGALPRRAWIVGCQAAECDELGIGLTPAVSRAVGEAVARVRELLAGLIPVPELAPAASTSAPDGADDGSERRRAQA